MVVNKNYPNDHFKKIPKPSETRWTFYRDVLESLTTQVEQIELFLQEDDEFNTIKRKMSQLFDSAGTTTRPTLSNGFVKGHFTFALFLLEKNMRVEHSCKKNMH